MNKRAQCSATVAAGAVLLVQVAAGVATVQECGNADAGDCCCDNGTPACADLECCQTVCAVDPFCCDVAWDDICVDQARELCGEICMPCCCYLCCPPGTPDEGEPCGSDTNGGCSSAPPLFIDAVCGATFCGRAFAAGGIRDTDWYLVDHPGGALTAEVVSEFPAVCLIVDGIDDCATFVAGDIGCGDSCENITAASARLPPGIYALFVATGECSGVGIFEGYPCGGGFNDYVLSIECQPCPADCEATPDGVVGIEDFLALLAQWGQVGALCDIDGGGVGITDFQELLAQWGPCL